MGISNSRAADNRRQVIAAIRGGGTLGNVWYVDSAATGASDTAGRGKTASVPFATIDFAVGQCTANNDDVIIVAPGHTETVTADSGIDVDVAGISVIGMGRGTDRPTITFTTAAGADFKLAAANVHVENLLFVAGVDALTGPIEISAAYCSLVDCEFQDGATGTIDTVDVVVGTAAADQALVDGFVHVGTSDALQSVIQFAAGSKDVEVRNCYITGSPAVGCIEMQNTTDLVRVHDNVLLSTNATDVCISLAATCTGMVYRNFMEIATDAQVTAITVVNDCSLFENYFVNVDAETGKLQGTASA